MIISDDPSISRVHAEIAVRPDGAARLRDLSKFGTKVDGRRVDKTAADGVPLLAEDGERACRLTFGCAKPKPRSAMLTRDIGPRGGRRQDHGRRGRRGDGPGLRPTKARRRSRPSPPPRQRASTNADDPANFHIDRAMPREHPRRTLPRTSPSRARRRMRVARRGGAGARRRLGGGGGGGDGAATAGGTDARVEDVSAREGRATVVFEPLPSRAGTGTRARDDATTATTTTRNFKKFRKTTRGPAKSLAGADTSSARRARRLAVAYADEAYDALHQWEDATVAAAHAAARADAQTAEEMFETGNRVRAPRGVDRRRANPGGAAAKGR